MYFVKLCNYICLKIFKNALIINLFYRNFHKLNNNMQVYEFKIAKNAVTC